jgi:hypothetical protein
MRRAVQLLCVVALLLASCASDTDEGKDAEPTGTAQVSAGSPSIGAATGATMPSLSPYVPRTDYEIPPWGELAREFDYDTTEALDVKVLSEERQRGVIVSDITYRSDGRTVPAVLVMPEGRGPFPAVIYAPTDNSGQGFFLADAAALARDGYAGLVLSSPQMRAKGRSFCFGLYCLDAGRNIAAPWTCSRDCRGSTRDGSASSGSTWAVTRARSWPRWTAGSMRS